MKIIHLSWDITSYTGGGERAVGSIVRAIGLVNECELCIVSKVKDSGAMPTLPGIAVHRIATTIGPFDNPVPNVRELARAIRKADIIHVHQSHTVLLDVVQILKRRDQRLVVSDHGGGGPNITRVIGRFNRVDGAVSHSQASYMTVSKLSDRIRCIPIPIDCNKFCVNEDSEVDSQMVVCVGRLLPHKGFDRVIEALPSSFRLTLIGQPYDTEYVRYLKSLSKGKDIQIMTQCDDDMMIQEINQAGVCVSSSVYKDYRGRRHPQTELFGLAPVEAAACGRPVVVSTAVPALQEEIRQGRIVGAVYDWQSRGELSSAIVAMASGEKYMENHEFVRKEYTPISVGSRMMEFYEDLLLRK